MDRSLDALRQRIEGVGVLIVVNGVVGNNVYRKLSPDEFPRFVLCDPYAPLVFINGADFKSAQMFTFAHELAHLWIGQDGVSNFEALQPPPNRVEQWCNAVAAEFLVPDRELQEMLGGGATGGRALPVPGGPLQSQFVGCGAAGVGSGLASRNEFFDFYNIYREDERRKQARQSAGGNFWNTQNVRVGLRFGSAVVRAAKEGRLLYREAYQLTGLHGKTFDRFAETLGFRTG